MSDGTQALIPVAIKPPISLSGWQILVGQSDDQFKTVVEFPLVTICGNPPSLFYNISVLSRLYLPGIIELALARDTGNNAPRQWSQSEFCARLAARRAVPIGSPTPFALLVFQYKWVTPNSIPVTNIPLSLIFALSKPYQWFLSCSRPCTCSSLSSLSPRFSPRLAPPPLISRAAPPRSIC